MYRIKQDYANYNSCSTCFRKESLRLYNYCSNNPVRYIDPDGNQPNYFMSIQDFFNFSLAHDSTARGVMVIGKAMEGDSVAQQILKESSEEVATEMAAEGLELTANAASVISEVTGDFAIEAIIIQPEVAGGLSIVSDISSGIEVLSRVSKSKITKDPIDIEKANKTAKKNIGSFIAGKIVIFFPKQVPKDVSDLASATIGKAASKIIDESIKKQEEQDKD